MVYMATNGSIFGNTNHVVDSAKIRIGLCPSTSSRGVGTLKMSPFVKSICLLASEFDMDIYVYVCTDTLNLWVSQLARYIYIYCLCFHM